MLCLNGMSQEVADWKPVGEVERKEFLRLWKQRFGLEKNRISGPFSQSEDGVWVRGERDFQRLFAAHPAEAAARLERENQVKRIARRAKDRAAHLQLVAEFEEKFSEEYPHWTVEAVHRCSQKAAQKRWRKGLLASHWKGKIAKSFPRLGRQGTRRVSPGPDFSRLSVEESPGELEERYGRS